MTDTVYMVTEWMGTYADPVLIFEDMADAVEHCARENREIQKIKSVNLWPKRFDWAPIQIQREEKHVGI